MKFILIFSVLFALALGLPNSINKQNVLPSFDTDEENSFDMDEEYSFNMNEENSFDMDQELYTEDLARLVRLVIKELEFSEHK